MGFRNAREEAGKTMIETAKAIGVTRQAVYDWERGEYKPSADMLMKLSAFYGCTVDKLLKNDEQ